MWTLPRNGLVALAAAGATVLASGALSAQEEQETPSACVSTVLPSEVAAGNAAARLSVTLAASIGEVTAFEAEEDSGLRLADPADLPRVPMSAEGEAPNPIQMANEGNRLTLWLSTADADAGTYGFTLVGSRGSCSGQLTVAPEGS